MAGRKFSIPGFKSSPIIPFVEKQKVAKPEIPQVVEKKNEKKKPKNTFKQSDEIKDIKKLIDEFVYQRDNTKNKHKLPLIKRVTSNTIIPNAIQTPIGTWTKFNDEWYLSISRAYGAIKAGDLVVARRKDGKEKLQKVISEILVRDHDTICSVREFSFDPDLDDKDFDEESDLLLDIY